MIFSPLLCRPWPRDSHESKIPVRSVSKPEQSVQNRTGRPRDHHPVLQTDMTSAGSDRQSNSEK